MNSAPLVVLVLSVWGAIVDSRYKRNGGKRPTRQAKILFLAAFLVVALFVTLMLIAPLRPGSEETFAGAISGLTTVILILLFGAWELGRCIVRGKNPLPHPVQNRRGITQ
jgi:peptidoglycan/LPS O-acetylase OafA/YrhL